MAAAKQYKLRYLPLFWDDLLEASLYIKNQLGSPQAAYKLVENVEARILDQAKSPETAAIYPTTREREYPYYWFAVGNYYVFYVLIDDIMEIRRCLYNKRNLKSLL